MDNSDQRASNSGEKILGSTSLLEMPFTTCEIVRERLKYLRGTTQLRWVDIGNSEEFHPVPMGTLYKIMTTGRVPKKWWKTLRVHGTQHPRIAISKVDVDRALGALTRNLSLEMLEDLSAGLGCYIHSRYMEAVGIDTSKGKTYHYFNPSISVEFAEGNSPAFLEKYKQWFRSKDESTT